MKTSSKELLRLIAGFKLLKAGALIIAGVGILKLVHVDIDRELEHWVRVFGLDPGSRFVDRAIQSITNLPPRSIREVGVGSFVYAALFLTEGVGLWMLKRWAEWFTIIVTSSLVPLEVFEIFRHPTLVRILVLLINLAVVAYLVDRIRHEPRA